MHYCSQMINFTPLYENIIRSGFTSAYWGEEPKSLAKALTILNKHRIETEESIISSKLLNRLNNLSLTDKDIDFVFQEYKYSTYSSA